jgi:hypothetical protein
LLAVVVVLAQLTLAELLEQQPLAVEQHLLLVALVEYLVQQTLVVAVAVCTLTADNTVEAVVLV